MVRVVVIDDHPALRAGLRTVLDGEPGIEFAGESNGDEENVWPVLNRTKPELVLLDYHLPHGDGLQLCYRIKQSVPAPRVVLYTAYASPALALAATLAHADGMLAKGVGARDLFEAIRRAHDGERVLPPISLTALREAYGKLDPDDRALVGMLIDGSTEVEIARTLRREPRAVRHAVHRILSGLRIDVAAAQLM
jgi:DNA-binding NarL/FixJ family response regulator